ncbi:MAG TPA: nuclear transport factor 2 family protein [Candidatus Cybelea sp.]|nr:nuclear transport factor 2 family protein [Candidatus Cybelea sp.]
MKWTVIALFAVVVASSLALGPPARAASDDNAQITALYQQFTTAFRHKDLDGIMSVYVAGPGLFVFDVGMPREHVGSDSYRADWKSLFAGFKGSTIPSFGISEMSLTISGDVAYSHSVQSFTATTTKGQHVALTVRVTDVLRKINGKWLIVMEHVSVPISFDTMKPDLSSKP